MAQKTTRPKSAQKQAAPPASEKSKDVAASDIYSTPRERSPLTPLQEEYCDLAGDLLLRGGHPDDVENLLYALLGHDQRRRFPNYPQDATEREQHVQKRIVESYPHQPRFLSSTWPVKPAAKIEPEIVESVAEQIRSTARDDVRDRFEEFMEDATPEEIRLLRDIFMSADTNGGDLGLATAFSDEIGRHREYVRVRYEHQELVEQYIDLLEKGKEKRSAAC